MFGFLKPRNPNPNLSDRISESKGSKNVNVKVSLSGTNSNFSNSGNIKGSTNNFDRIRNNLGKHQATLQRLSQYNSGTQALSVDTLTKMETMPKKQDFVRNYYSMLSNYNSKLGSTKNGLGFGSTNAIQQQKRLRRIASLDEVDEILSKLTTELTLPTNKEKHFFNYKIDRLALEQLGIKKEYIDKIEEIATDFHPKIYRELGFKLNGANNAMHNFLIDGKKAYEIVYDNPDKPTQLITCVEIDANNLTKFYDNGAIKWKYQFNLDSSYARTVSSYNKDLLKNKNYNNGFRILYDWQVNYIDWSEDSVNGHVSYVHGLMKSANVLRIMEETMLVWYVTNSSYRTLHKVPTQGLMGTYAATAVLQEKEEYSTDIQYIGETGEIFIEDSPNIPFERTTFVSDGEYGEPSVEVLNDRGASLDKTDVVDYFKGKLYRASKMPQSRFDSDGGEWALDPSRAQREEVFFAGMCMKIKNTFAPVLLKPLFIELGLKIPELDNDVSIFDNINIQWNGVNQFKELLDLTVLTEKLSYIDKIKDSLVMQDANGDDIQIIPWTILLKKYLGYTQEDLDQISDARYEELERVIKETKKIEDLKKKHGISTNDNGGGGKRW